MNSIPKKHTGLFNHYYSTVLSIVCIIWPLRISAEQQMLWEDIHLTENQGDASFSTDHLGAGEYTPENAFDTTWICVADMAKPLAPIYCKLSSLDTVILGISSGTTKNTPRFTQYPGPLKIRLSLYAAVQPQGYVSETGALYRAVSFPGKQTAILKDRFGVQPLALNFEKKPVSEFQKRVDRHYQEKFDVPAAESCIILQIDITGTPFNDSVVSADQSPEPRIQNVYLSEEENRLLFDTRREKGITAFYAPSSVLQVLEVSETKKWAILIAMPADIQGRAETTYLLVDLFNKNLFNPQLEKMTRASIGGNLLYFKTEKDGRLYVIYADTEGKEHGMELR
jgi:hypothetical protein